MKKISVIIPSYRPGAYIIETLLSIASQTLEAKYFEVIVVLNGDLSFFGKLREYLEQILTNHDKSLLISCESGVSAARNLGLEKSKGEYIVFMDDDDLISPNYLKKLLDNAITDGLVISNCLLFNQTPAEYLNSYTSSTYNSMNKTCKVTYSMHSLFSSVWGKLIPKKLICNHRFNTDVSIGEDCCFMIALLPEVQRLVKAPSDCIYYIRNRPGSVSRNHKPFGVLLKNKIAQLKDYIVNIRPYITGNSNIMIYINRVASVLLYWK